MTKHFNVLSGKQEEVFVMSKTVNIENKFLLTFAEASQYFGIGENKLRHMASLAGKSRLASLQRLSPVN